MTTTIEVTSDLARQILANASAQGLPVETYLVRIVNAPLEDTRLAAMREAVNDPLFLADLREVREDFRYVDCE